MAYSDALEHIAERLDTATTYTDVFGAIPAGDLPSRKTALRAAFGKLAILVHPDQHPAELAKEAQAVFTSLNSLRQGAEQALTENRYEAPIGARSGTAATVAEFELGSRRAQYRLAAHAFASGDFSVLYSGCVATNPTERVIVKVARAPTDNPWLEKEAALLARFRDAPAGEPLAGIRRYVPELLDTFLVDGGKGTRFRATVLRAVPDIVSITDIINAYPKGLNPPEAAWVYRRIIAQTLAASMAGVVHGGMTPDHILVDPFKHEPLHIGFVHAVPPGQRLTHVVDRWKELYPPEVFSREPVDHRTDLYMAAMVMVKLLGGDTARKTLPLTVPKSVGEVILRSLESSPARRPPDGKQLLDDLTRVVRKEWGRVYRPLSMPVH